MRIAAKVRLEKEEHPERFCRIGRCLWRVSSPGRPDTPCRNHPKPEEKPALAPAGETANLPSYPNGD